MDSKKQKKGAKQTSLNFSLDPDAPEDDEYNPTAIINQIRGHVERWRSLSNPADWGVSPETARLLQHWRHHDFAGVRPFFCQVEAVETAIWLTEVAPKLGSASVRSVRRRMI